MSKGSSIIFRNPFLDSDEILRVGGRLNKATKLISKEENPIILPGKHPLTKQIDLHCHEIRGAILLRG